MSTPGLSSVIRQFTPGVFVIDARTVGASIMICAAAEVRAENGRTALNLDVPARDAAVLRVPCPGGRTRGKTSACAGR